MDDLLKQMYDDLRNANTRKDEIEIHVIEKRINVHQKSKDWQQIINLPEYNSVIEKIISRLVEEGVILELWKNSQVSKYQRTPVSNKFIYRILVKQICVNKKEMIYDILHEFGHFLDKEIISREELETNNLKRLKREITAWLFADEEFLKISELKKDFEEYEEYKWLCLKSYGITKDNR